MVIQPTNCRGVNTTTKSDHFIISIQQQQQQTLQCGHSSKLFSNKRSLSYAIITYGLIDLLVTIWALSGDGDRLKIHAFSRTQSIDQNNVNGHRRHSPVILSRWVCPCDKWCWRWQRERHTRRSPSTLGAPWRNRSLDSLLGVSAACCFVCVLYARYFAACCWMGFFAQANTRKKKQSNRWTFFFSPVWEYDLPVLTSPNTISAFGEAHKPTHRPQHSTHQSEKKCIRDQEASSLV